MADRLGNVLYWLGTIIAVLAIGGAVVWNGWGYYDYKQSQKKVAAFEGEGPANYFALELERRLMAGASDAEFDAHLASEGLTEEEVRGFNEWSKHQKLANRIAEYELDQAAYFFIGGLVVLGGLIAFGIGWVARYVLRGPVK